MGLNICVLGGRLTRDPEIKQIGPNQVSVVNFTIAIPHSYKKQNGELVKETTFVDCTAYDTGAEAIAKNFVKGDPITVDGRLRTRTFQDKLTGKNRSKNELRVGSFQYPIYKRQVQKEEDE